MKGFIFLVSLLLPPPIPYVCLSVFLSLSVSVSLSLSFLQSSLLPSCYCHNLQLAPARNHLSDHLTNVSTLPDEANISKERERLGTIFLLRHDH